MSELERFKRNIRPLIRMSNVIPRAKNYLTSVSSNFPRLDIKRVIPDRIVQRMYVRAGEIFGDICSYLYIGESVGFEKYLKKWAKWEQEYALRGYKTISLDDFINLCYGVSLDHLLGQKRNEYEEPILHAKRFVERYKGRDLEEAIGLKGIVSYNPKGDPIEFEAKATWIPPSTKDEDIE